MVIRYRRFRTTYRRSVRMAGHAARMREARNEVGILFGDLEVIEYGRCGSVVAETGGNVLSREDCLASPSVVWCVCVCVCVHVPVYCNVELIFGVTLTLLHDAVW